ncbi:MAG: YtxH domain-containing protein [Chloroflexota bacterium]|jgi:gas vesicle protein|nr:YtxH domain-containing protein [Chloroflexota bacterium]
MGGFLKFILGGAAGTAVGLAVASLLAPQKGSELRAATHERLTAAKAAGDEAERQTASAMQDRFRQRVGDSTAFTPYDPAAKDHA